MVAALYRRYRPDSFTDMIGQSQVTEPLMTALRTGRVNHAYLFSGPRGCGKTSSARILARCMNCAQGPTDTPCGTCDSCIELARDGGGSLDVIEIDAASHGGVDDARDLRERAVLAPSRDRYKIFIIDEAHMVTAAGFNALLKVVEEPPEHVRFVFATTEPEKVIGTIRSRTHHFPFRLIPPAPMLAYVEQLCRSEGVTADGGVLPLVVRAGGGSARDTLSLLDQVIAGSEGEHVDYGRAVALLGFTATELLDETIESFAGQEASAAYGVLDRVVQSGQDPRRFVEDLLERVRDLILAKATGDGVGAVLRGLSPEELERLRTQSDRFTPAALTTMADLVNTTLTEMSGVTSPRLHLELMVARVLVASRASWAGESARIEVVPGGAGSTTPGARPSDAEASAPGATPGARPTRDVETAAAGAPGAAAAGVERSAPLGRDGIESDAAGASSDPTAPRAAGASVDGPDGRRAPSDRVGSDDRAGSDDRVGSDGRTAAETAPAAATGQVADAARSAWASATPGATDARPDGAAGDGPGADDRTSAGDTAGRGDDRNAADAPDVSGGGPTPDPDPGERAAEVGEDERAQDQDRSSTVDGDDESDERAPDVPAVQPASRAVAEVDPRSVSFGQVRDAWPSVLEHVKQAGGIPSWTAVYAVQPRDFVDGVLRFEIDSRAALERFKTANGDAAAPSELVREAMRSLLGVPVKFQPRIVQRPDQDGTSAAGDPPTPDGSGPSDAPGGSAAPAGPTRPGDVAGPRGGNASDGQERPSNRRPSGAPSASRSQAHAPAGRTAPTDDGRAAPGAGSLPSWNVVSIPGGDGPPADGPGSAWGEAAEDADPDPVDPAAADRRAPADAGRAPDPVDATSAGHRAPGGGARDFDRAPEVVALRETTARAAAEEPIVAEDPVIPVARPGSVGRTGTRATPDEPEAPAPYDDEPPPEDPGDDLPTDSGHAPEPVSGPTARATGQRTGAGAAARADADAGARSGTSVGSGSAPRAGTMPTAGSRPGGLPPIERYGESVIRERLGARFVGEEELPAPAPVAGPGFEGPMDQEEV